MFESDPLKKRINVHKKRQNEIKGFLTELNNSGHIELTDDTERLIAEIRRLQSKIEKDFHLLIAELEKINKLDDKERLKALVALGLRKRMPNI